MTGPGVRGIRVVITGSTRGLGLATAERLVGAGAHVVVNGRDTQRCRSVAEQLGTVGVGGCVERQDVATQLVELCVSEFGGVDVVINNAGMTRDAMLTRMSYRNFRDVLAAHVEGAWLVTQAAVTAMKAAGTGGAIVNVTSGSGLFGNPGQSNYAAAKGGVLGMTRALSIELARFGIDVNAVAPVVRTDMTAGLVELLGETHGDLLGEPSAVAGVFEYLCSPSSRGMTGQVLSFDGRDLNIWSHPRIEASFEAVDADWTMGDFGAALGDSAAWQLLNPDRLGQLLADQRAGVR